MGHDLEELRRRAKAALRESGRNDPVRTSWFVVTGAPSAGKSTLLRDLKHRGYACMAEAPRQYFKEQERLGNSVEKVWKNPLATVDPIHRLRREIEEALDPNELTILDTAIPDTLVYALILGAEYRHIAREASRFRYRHVFIMDPLPLEMESVRVPIAHQRREIDRLTDVVYRSLGYNPRRVPELPRTDRVEAVLQFLTANEAG